MRTEPKPEHERREQLVDEVKKQTGARGRAPSLRELADAMQLSVPRVHQLIERCCEMGKLVKEPHGARTVRLPRPGEELQR
jgi:DNA-binding MarR family transcriptional regulator